MHRVLAGMLLIVALAGCSGGNDKGDDGTTTTAPAPTTGGTTTAAGSTTSGGATTSGPAPTTGPANRAPTASLEANETQGVSPLAVEFTLDGADADGNDLTWTLDVDGDGTVDFDGTGDDFPATVTHTFDLAGDYLVVLNVTDDELSAEDSLHIQVAAPSVEPDPFAGTCPGLDYVTIAPDPGPPEAQVFYIENTGGTWFYQESNDLPGLQLSDEPSLAMENHPAGAGCLNGDTLLF
ncbi:MAG TPA: PKD domain-containing protein [Candidatus Thermoplasmatota archaeon]|nr:PKD domain-containing protein [Candidatus Thermoplasmatota archaeon]